MDLIVDLFSSARNLPIWLDKLAATLDLTTILALISCNSAAGAKAHVSVDHFVLM